MPGLTPPQAGTAAPIVLGSGESDAGTLIEASPAIDRPPKGDALDDAPAFEGAEEGEAAPDAPAEPAAPAAPVNEAGSGEAQPPATLSPSPDAPALAAAPDEPRPTDEAGPGGNSAGGDRQAAPHPPGNSGSHAGEDDWAGEDDRASDDDRAGDDEEDETADADQENHARSDDSTRMVETHLSTLLGLKVSIAERNRDDGVLSIHYNSESELTDLVSRLNRMPTGRRAE